MVDDEAQMAFLAGIVEELEHFSLVSSILSKKGLEISKEPFKLSIETDELRAGKKNSLISMSNQTKRKARTLAPIQQNGLLKP